MDNIKLKRGKDDVERVEFMTIYSKEGRCIYQGCPDKRTPVFSFDINILFAVLNLTSGGIRIVKDVKLPHARSMNSYTLCMKLINGEK